MRLLRAFFAIVCLQLFAATFASFARAASVEEVMLYNKPDRQKILVDGARKEGKITWYTSLIIDQVVRPVKEAFEKKYPFIQIEYSRSNSERLVQKMFAEYQGKRYEVDIADGTVTAPMIKKGGYLQRFYSPYLADYPAELKDPQGYWGVSNVYYFALGYNTRMVKPTDVPKTYDDLLNPRWKNQMMWSTSRGSGAPMMIGNILQTMGQEAGKAYLQKLKAQNVAKTTASNRQLLDLVIAGEYPLGLHIFHHHAFISKSAGAPVDWAPLEPLSATINTISPVTRSPHPHAAMLLLDFILSEEGQKVIQAVNYLPSHPKVPAKQADLKPGGGRFKRALYFTPDSQVNDGDAWVDYFEKNFLK
jgi:ABC-type Fe3+ transport system substrate-binding protein